MMGEVSMSRRRRIKLVIICIGFLLMLLYLLAPFISIVSRIHLTGIVCHSRDTEYTNLGYWKAGSLIRYEARFSTDTFCGIAPSILLSMMLSTTWNIDVSTYNFMLRWHCCTEISADIVLTVSDFYFFVMRRLQFNTTMSYRVIFQLFGKPLEEFRVSMLSAGGSIVCSAFLSLVSDENAFKTHPKRKPDYVV
jgi:hypothetical protein